MSAACPVAFEREHGFTEAEWLRCLPAAVAPHMLERLAPGAADVRLAGGARLTLRWKVLPDRRIALLSMPRLGVRYVFDPEVSKQQREDFLRGFDRYIQRGGG